MTDLSPAPPSAFARLGRAPARCVLAATVVVILLSVTVSVSRYAKGYANKPSRGANDIDLYWSEVDRMHAGAGYYQAASAELRVRGYPTRSVFNWRTPLPIWLIGTVPQPVLAQAMLGLFSLGTLLAGFELSAREGGKSAAVVGSLAMCGALLPCVLNDLYIMPVMWSGVLLALSVALLAIGWTRLGVVSGITALFLRELAGPYCFLAFCFALWGRRFREAAMWAAGFAAYGMFFVWHVSQVHAMQTASDTAHQHGWMQLGGLAFLLSVTQVHGFLLVLPQWVTAVYFSLVLLGFASWTGPAGRRVGLTAMLYVLFFGFIGQDFNQYWGSMIAPLFALGAARAPLALRDLWRAARGQSLEPGSLTMSGPIASGV